MSDGKIRLLYLEKPEDNIRRLAEKFEQDQVGKSNAIGKLSEKSSNSQTNTFDAVPSSSFGATKNPNSKLKSGKDIPQTNPFLKEDEAEKKSNENPSKVSDKVFHWSLKSNLAKISSLETKTIYSESS